MHNMASFEKYPTSTTAAATAAAATADGAAFELHAIQPFVEKFAEFVTTEIPELASYVSIAKMLPIDVLLSRFKSELAEYNSVQNAADALFTKASVSPSEKTREKFVRYLQFFSKIAERM